ncbi:hypothetical protein [Streptomyces sp. MMBL 11-1]|nr:hypothetical protein [Streptomyces sp. MMBL 11-1]
MRDVPAREERDLVAEYDAALVVPARARWWTRPFVSDATGTVLTE